MKILVVEDNESLSYIIKEILQDEGQDVRTARDAAEGYRNYLAFRPDLIITDIEMPEKSGLELMERVRAHNPNIRAIYMSGELSRFRSLLEEERNKYQASLLQKPFSKVDLIKMVSGNYF